MKSSLPGMTLGQLIEHCVQQAAVADAEMQLLQRSAWRSFNKGFPLVEGLDHLEFLGLTEVKLTFRLEPSRPNWCVRLYRWIFKKTPETGKLLFRLCRPSEKAAADAIDFTLTIGRGREGETRVSTEPEFQDREKIHVVGFNA
jgi:hypothetical protein